MKSIKVILLEPGKPAYEAEIDGTLHGLQQIVGGLIEACYPFDEQVCIVCNEEGKLNGLPLNRAIRGEDGSLVDVIAGTAFLCSCKGESFSSLSEEQTARYLALFERPELFLMLDGQLLALSM